MMPSLASRVMLPDVVAAVRCRTHELVEDAALEDGVFEARVPVFVPKEG